MGYFFDSMKTSGMIIGVLYVIIVSSVTIALLGFKTEAIQKIFSESIMTWWKWIFEILALIAIVKMGYFKIAVCMLYEDIAVAYIYVAISCLPKDEKKEATSGPA